MSTLPGLSRSEFTHTSASAFHALVLFRPGASRLHGSSISTKYDPSHQSRGAIFGTSMPSGTKPSITTPHFRFSLRRRSSFSSLTTTTAVMVGENSSELSARHIRRKSRALLTGRLVSRCSRLRKDLFQLPMSRVRRHGRLSHFR